MMTSDSVMSLYDHLRRPTPALGNVTAADAHVPLYTFPADPFESTPKLKRIDSFPAVPDAFEQRCSSPLLATDAFLSFGLTADASNLDSFNSLPLAIPTGGGQLDWSPLGKTSRSRDDDAQLVPQLDTRGPGGRAQPRRHASDVLLCGRVGGTAASPDPKMHGRSLLEAALMVRWEDCADKGLFRYDVSQCETRVLPGDLGFIAQLNEGRATKKRATEFTMDKVLQPFDAAKFNFRKAPITEALVAFQPLYGMNTAAGGFDASGYSSAAAEAFVVPPKAPLASLALEQSPSSFTDMAQPAIGNGLANPTTTNLNLIYINVSPIDHGHVLLVPRVQDCLPQAVDPGTALLALQFARELGNPHFRVGYNSLGAFATINHLHFHSYYQPRLLPCEVAATEILPLRLGSVKVAARRTGAAAASLPRKRKAYEMEAASPAPTGVRVSRLVDYPVNAFVVEAEPEGVIGGTGAALPSAAVLEAVATVVGAAAERMQAANQPFNLLISECGRRVFVFPQCYAERQAAGQVPQELLDTGVNPAAFEIAGHLVLKRAEDFETASQGWAERLLAEVSLDEEEFMRVAEMCFGDSGAFSACHE